MARIILLDGGTGQELLNRSKNQAPRRWSAEYLMSEPDLVRQVHLDYIRAGARLITIDAYAATYTRMAMIGAEADVEKLQERACTLALEARDAAGADGAGVAIAGCLPPLNGSYRPDRVRPFDMNLSEYERIAAQQARHVDLFICETMSTGEEARAAARAATGTGKPVWVGWSLKDNGGTQLRSGEAIGEAFRALADLPVAAVLANCTAPESVSAAMKDLVGTGLPAGGYANGFTSIPMTFVPGRTREQLRARQDLDPDTYARFAMSWVAAGATIVGGCCEVGPAHIARLREALLDSDFEIAAPPLRTSGQW